MWRVLSSSASRLRLPHCTAPLRWRLQRVERIYHQVEPSPSLHIFIFPPSLTAWDNAVHENEFLFCSITLWHYFSSRMTITPRQLRHLLQLNTVMLAFIIRGAGFVVLFWFDFLIFVFLEKLWSTGVGWWRLSPLFYEENRTDVIKSCFNNKAEAGFLL